MSVLPTVCSFFFISRSFIACFFVVFFFFFQAEDGIRDTSVTGVQTCALPISRRLPGRGSCAHHGAEFSGRVRALGIAARVLPGGRLAAPSCSPERPEPHVER